MKPIVLKRSNHNRFELEPVEIADQINSVVQFEDIEDAVEQNGFVMKNCVVEIKEKLVPYYNRALNLQALIIKFEQDKNVILYV